MRLKRWMWLVTALAALVLAAAAVGCGDDDNESGSSGGSESAAAGGESGGETGGAIDVGTGKITPKNTDRIAMLLQASKAYSYPLAQEKAAKAEAEKLGVEVDVFYSNLDPAVERANFQQALTSGKYGGIVMQPVTAQLCVPVEKTAAQRGVLVLIFGNPLCDKGTGAGEELWAKGTIGYIGGQNNIPGINEVLEAAAEKQQGPQKVILAMGIQGHPSVVAWETAWKEFAAEHPDWKLLETVYTDFTTPGAFNAMQNALNAHRDTTVIFSPYIDITAGVTKAVSARNLGDQIAVYENGGGSKVSVGLVKGGKLAGSLPVYPSSLGSSGVQVMAEALKGKQPEKMLENDGNPEPFGVLTPENVGEYEPQW